MQLLGNTRKSWSFQAVGIAMVILDTILVSDLKLLSNKRSTFKKKSFQSNRIWFWDIPPKTNMEPEKSHLPKGCSSCKPSFWASKCLFSVGVYTKKQCFPKIFHFSWPYNYLNAVLFGWIFVGPSFRDCDFFVRAMETSPSFPQMSSRNSMFLWCQNGCKMGPT